MQLNPLMERVYPGLQEHTRDPYVLVHWCSHGWLLVGSVHSLMSAGRISSRGFMHTQWVGARGITGIGAGGGGGGGGGGAQGLGPP